MDGAFVLESAEAAATRFVAVGFVTTFAVLDEFFATVEAGRAEATTFVFRLAICASGIESSLAQRLETTTRFVFCETIVPAMRSPVCNWKVTVSAENILAGKNRPSASAAAANFPGRLGFWRFIFIQQSGLFRRNIIARHAPLAARDEKFSAGVRSQARTRVVQHVVHPPD